MQATMDKTCRSHALVAMARFARRVPSTAALAAALSAVVGAVSGLGSARDVTSVTESSLAGETSRYRHLLRVAPGNLWLDSAWQWNQANPEEGGGVRVPSAIVGGPVLVALEAGAFQRKFPGRLGMSFDDIIYVVNDAEATLTPERMAALRSLGVVFKEPLAVHAAAAFVESYLVHEAQHHGLRVRVRRTAPSTSAPPGQISHGEFAALRAQCDSLASAGVIEPCSDSTVLRLVMTYVHPDTLGFETMVAFRGQLVPELRPFLPTGGEFQRVVERHMLGALQGGPSLSADDRNLLDALSPNVWSTEYGRAYLAAVARYFQLAELEHRAEVPSASAVAEPTTTVAQDKMKDFSRFIEPRILAGQ
ncbi:MAG: hypothetical protein ACKVPX_09735 [Myxococcaceae bacterium]